MTASSWCWGAILAVFFSLSANAADSSLTSLEQGMSELVYGMSRSIVTVEAIAQVPSSGSNSSGQHVNRRDISTGIVCDSMGHVLAHAAMVAGRKRLMVAIDGMALPARLIAIDYLTGLAVLRTSQPIGVPVKLSSTRACAGQMVVALGNSYGLRAAPSLGFCAGLRVDDLMQFSVPVSSGAVGGGVFDMTGRLLGIVVGGTDEEARITLAVPAFQLPAIVHHLLTRGDRHAAYLGIESADIEIVPPLEIRVPVVQASSTATDRILLDHGIFVTNVLEASPAERAGLVTGDLVVSYNGNRYTSAAELAKAVQTSVPGSPTTITVVRDNQLVALECQLARKQLDFDAVKTGVSPFDTEAASQTELLWQAIDQMQQRIDQLESGKTDRKR